MEPFETAIFGPPAKGGVVQSERRLRRSIGTVFDRCHGDVTQSLYFRLCRFAARSDVRSQLSRTRVSQGADGWAKNRLQIESMI